MKLAIAFSSKDQIDLTKQTFDRLCDPTKDFDIYWADGSQTDEGLKYFENYRAAAFHSERVVGGADACIAWKLSEMLKHPYTHVGILENDCLLDEDWFEATIALFEKGKQDGLDVGAVSPRSYCDRVLIQRDGYAICHNLGAGVVIFKREAAELVLRTFRTGFWPENVRLFAQISGIDLRTYAAFRGNEQSVTTDWLWDAMLARHGFASLALTPARCTMIGQVPSLEKQGLELTTAHPQQHIHSAIVQKPFELYRANLAAIRLGGFKVDGPNVVLRQNGGMIFFAHQIGYLAGATPWLGNLVLKWTQGYGPFAYVAGVGGASLSVRISGSCSFLATGGLAGARVTITDTRSGFRTEPDLPAGDEPVSIQVPGSPIPRTVTFDMAEGAVFYGLQTVEPQILDATFCFNWNQLPEAE